MYVYIPHVHISIHINVHNIYVSQMEESVFMSIVFIFTYTYIDHMFYKIQNKSVFI